MELENNIGSKADVFLSKEALQHLDIDKKNLHEGICKMKLRIAKDMQNEKNTN